MTPQEATASLLRLRQALTTAVVGQEAAVDAVLAAYAASGHVLIEGVPGIGKTLLARALAAALGARFTRAQFTPDLMPGDLLGTNVFDAATREFRLVKGPIFSEVLMADEVNRTPPKTQSALLEAMQERQVTIDGRTLPLDEHFFVMATQNPVEFEGTYPLPEAQLDRFLLRVEMGLPEAEAEVELYRQFARGERSLAAPALAAAVTPEEARALRRASALVHVKDELLRYLAQLVAAVRRSPHVELGISPRGGLALLESARAAALLTGRDFLLPDDLKRLLQPCWGHRILLRAESELEGHTTARILDEVARSVEVPR
jgi:MoxR-like ATPase